MPMNSLASTWAIMMSTIMTRVLLTLKPPTTGESTRRAPLAQLKAIFGASGHGAVTWLGGGNLMKVPVLLPMIQACTGMTVLLKVTPAG